MKFVDLGLRPELLRAVTDAGYETPTPIQEKGIPPALAGQDVLGCAQTGTGKTAAFLLPILQRLAEGKRGKVRALVVTPTRELAAQIADQACVYGQFLPIRNVCIFGGVGIVPQTQRLRAGVELLIATPGRLLDHMRQGHVRFDELEVLVLDEADRMLDMGFLPDVRRILAALPDRRQNLFFSATMPSEIEDLIQRTMRTPVVVEVTPRASTAKMVRQVIHAVGGDDKRDMLCHLLAGRDMTQVLVFTRTKMRANRLAKQLEKTGRRVAAIHGNKSQGARTQALEGFRSGRIDTLVATDIAARGLDVEGISHVVNFDMPNVPEDYVHRIGRTARAGMGGDAISLVAPEEDGHIRAIERLIGQRIPRQAVDGFRPSPKSQGDGLGPEPRHRYPAPGRGAGNGRSGNGRPGASRGRAPAPAVRADRRTAPQDSRPSANGRTGRQARAAGPSRRARV